MTPGRRAAAAAALALGAVLGAALGTVLGAACGRRAPDDATAQGAALRALFREREHARSVVLWADAGEPGPVFSALGSRAAPPDAAGARALGAASGLAVARATAADMERLFAAHPDGWAAFYAAHPGTAGLVEVGPVARSGDTAAVVVGRSCGEQCRNAWRVILARRAGRWTATRVAPVRVPR